MSRKLKLYAVLNVMGWVTIMPVLMAMLLDPFVDFRQWPGGALVDAPGNRVARVAPPVVQERAALARATGTAGGGPAGAASYARIAGKFLPHPGPRRSTRAASATPRTGARRERPATPVGRRSRGSGPGPALTPAAPPAGPAVGTGDQGRPAARPARGPGAGAGAGGRRPSGRRRPSHDRPAAPADSSPARPDGSRGAESRPTEDGRRGGRSTHEPGKTGDNRPGDRPAGGP